MDQKGESEVKNWIEQVLEVKLGNEGLFEMLKDGVILCNLINKIDGTPSKFPNKLKASFVQMENICYFIESARRLGVPDPENFQTIDLFEGKNMVQVVHCLYSLSRHLNKNGREDLPVIGPKLVDEVKFTFNQTQLDEAKRTISLQYGHISPDVTNAEKNIR